MKRYAELFRFPNVWVLVLSAFPARVAYGMVGLSIFFKVSSTESISVAGLALGLNAAAGSFTAGIRGSFMDRYGMKWPLRVMVPAYATMMITLNMSHDRNTMLILAFVMGLTAPPINLSVRPLWKEVITEDWLRTAYAVDTAVMSTAGVIGPVLATTLSLSSHPGSALLTGALCMLVGGGSLAITKVARGWKPEKQPEVKVPMWRHKPLQLLVIEGCFIGFGWGVFDVAVPAFAKIEGVAYRTAWILTAMGIANIIGGLLGGLVSKKVTPLGALRKTYFVWFIFSIPVVFTYPDWSMVIGAAALGLVGGAIQVFYWEVMEAVRPQGSPSGMMGWLWTIEGTLMSIGSASGGWISDKYSPTIGLGISSICIGIGFTILTLGRGRLAAANKLPTDEEDLAAMKDNATTTQ